MAVSPISNVNYINQNSQVSSVQQANAQIKLDFQTMVNLQEMQDRQEEIQEVRPTEETLKTDEDKEGNGKRDQEGNQNQNQKKSQKDSQDEIQLGEDGTIQHLNISV
ncbi:hypothetical protein BA920_03075 [Helicobacter pullorum]|uniref:hypothetical protein n=1 Tax=Helicobacter pullorum TaxID=35818 RepID=UPI000816A3E5|nr:hypothetical protein [Helicobacter pullorum]OCR05922.1 hypothetical protein BA920_03075 [Helicobacter pullorum]